MRGHKVAARKDGRRSGTYFKRSGMKRRKRVVESVRCCTAHQHGAA